MVFFLMTRRSSRPDLRLGRVFAPSRRRRAIGAALEPLEERLVLTSNVYTWSGLGDGQTWSLNTNWQGNVVPPSEAAVVFPLISSLPKESGGGSNPTNGTIDIDSADVSSITADDSYTFQGEGNNGTLTLDANSSIVIAATATVTLQAGLDVTVPGTTTVSFSGNAPTSTGLDVVTQQVSFPGPTGLRPIKVGGSGTLTLGSTTTLLGWNVFVGANSTATVNEFTFPQIGSLSGSGMVEMQGSPTDGTHLSVNPPQGVTSEFDGMIEGSGGLFSIDDGNDPGQNAGTQIIGTINPGDAGEYQLEVNSGTMQVNDSVEAQQVTVASGATFGGPASMTFTGRGSESEPDVVFNSRSTFAVTLNGTATGEFTKLMDTDFDASDGQSTVQLGGSDLSVQIGSGYTPKLGDNFTIISTTNGTIAGPFANAANNATVTLDNVGFRASYSQDSVMLKVVSLPSTISISVPTQTPTYGQSVTFSASVAPISTGLPTPTGTIQFEVNGMDLGNPVVLVNGSATSIPTTKVPAGADTITAVYSGDSTFAVTTNDVPLSVNKAALTVTADNKSKVYGAADPVLSYTVPGLLNDDPSSVVSGVTLSTATGAAATAGTHVITATGGTATNYMVADANGTLTVSQAAALTVTANDESKVYGAADPTLTYTVVGAFFYGDGPSVVSGVTLSAPTGAAATAGTHVITATGGTAANYMVTLANGTLSVSQAAALTVTPNAESKVYGGADPTRTYTVSGTFYYGDGPSVVSGVTLSTATGAAATAGTHTITATGGTAANYAITDDSGTLTVSRAPLSIMPDNEFKTYGQVFTFTGTELTTGTLYYNDTVTSATLTSAGAAALAVVPGSPYPISASNAVGTGLGNYLISYAAGSMTVNPLGLTVSGITVVNKVYDGTTVASINTGSAALVGVLVGEAVNLYTGAAHGTFIDKNVGDDKTVAIAGLSISGPDAGNYFLMQTMPTADITPRAISASITAANNSYDGTTDATITGRTLVGVLSPDSVTLVVGTATFADKNVGNDKLVTATGLSLTGADAGNYTVNSTAMTSANIAPAMLLVTGLAVGGKVYNGTTSATLNTSSAGLSGVISGDQVKLVTAGATAVFGNVNVGNGKPVVVSGLSLSGADSGNYTLVAPLGLIANITPAPLLVTATNQSMTYGGTVPILTYTTSGLVQGDTPGSALMGTLATIAPGSAAGSYPITRGTLSAINYTITFKGAELTVAPAPTTITLPLPVRVSLRGRRVYEVVATVSTTVPGLIPTGSVLVQQGHRKTRVPVASNGTAILAQSRTRPVGERYTVTFLPNNGNYTQSKPTSKSV